MASASQRLWSDSLPINSIGFRACASNGTVVASAATNDVYLRQTIELGKSAAEAGVACIAVAVSTAVSPALLASTQYVRPLWLPRASDWRPPAHWCAKHIGGWRHSHVLRMGAMLHVLRAGHNVLFVDGDWRLAASPLAMLAHQTRHDVVAVRDITRFQLNVGMVWLRSTPATVEAMRRVENRTFAAWDQAVFSEEMGASRWVACCYYALKGYVRHGSSKAKGTLRSSARASACRTDKDSVTEFGGAPALSPPRGDGALQPMYPHWKANSYNELNRAYNGKRCSDCSNKCVTTRCSW